MEVFYKENQKWGSQMKKVISGIVALLLCFGCAFAEPLLSPEKTVDAFNTMLAEHPTKGMEQHFAYLESSDEFGLLIVSEVMMVAAVASNKAKENTDDWRACKAMSYDLYTSMRSLLDTYGYADNRLSVSLVTAFTADGVIYYAVGDTKGEDCTVNRDIITDDTELSINKTK
ncbi:MAG: hypothetical protein RSC98_08690 [Clostridia bacterium]